MRFESQLPDDDYPFASQKDQKLVFNSLNFDIKIRRDNRKITYELRIYELVDDWSLSQAISHKLTVDRIQAVKELRKYEFTNYIK